VIYQRQSPKQAVMTEQKVEDASRDGRDNAVREEVRGFCLGWTTTSPLPSNRWSCAFSPGTRQRRNLMSVFEVVSGFQLQTNSRGGSSSRVESRRPRAPSFFEEG